MVHRAGPVLVLLVSLGAGGCAESPQATLRIELPEPIVFVLPDLGVRIGPDCAGGALCLRWSGDPHTYFQIAVPPAEGTYSLDLRTIHYDAPGLEYSEHVPGRRICGPDCTGALSVAVDTSARALHVMVTAAFPVTYHHCRTRYCDEWIPRDDGLFDRRLTPCDRGFCPDYLPCSGSVIHSGDQGCKNPDLVAASLSVTASGLVREADLAR